MVCLMMSFFFFVVDFLFMSSFLNVLNVIFEESISVEIELYLFDFVLVEEILLLLFLIFVFVFFIF